MPAFEYIALGPDGRRQKGIAEGESGRHVRERLRERGLTLLSVEEVRRRAGGSMLAALFGPRLSAEQVAITTRLLGTLLGSGLPLDDALRAVAEQADDRAVERVLLGVRARVLEGQGLAQAMEQFPGVFPGLYLATIAAGEQTPHLGPVLGRLADYLEERRALAQKVQIAMLYPAVLTVTAVAIVAGLLAFVVPEVVKVFAHLDQQLPLLTRGLIALADWVRVWGPWAALAGLAVSAALAWWLRKPGPRAALDRLLLALPIAGRLVREANAARFARTLSILLGSGVPMLDALRITGRALTSAPIRDAIANATVAVQEGVALHQALRNGARLPPLTVHLVASGEASGQLEQMLDTAARAHERTVQSLVTTLLALLEPILILTMGVMVLLIVVAILLPIFDLNQMV